MRDFAERYTAAWCSQDAAKVASFYSERGSLRVNSGAAAVGRSAITAVAQSFMSAFPDLEVLLDDLVFEGGTSAVYRWTLKGGNTGTGGTGKRVCISGFEQWEIGSDGLIAESRGYFDEAEYRRQIEHGV